MRWNCTTYMFDPTPGSGLGLPRRNIHTTPFYLRQYDQSQLHRPFGNWMTWSGIGAKDEESKLKGSTQFGQATGDVSFLTVGTMLRRIGHKDGRKIALFKIDVEGYEKFVFDGGPRFFANPNVAALIVELNDAGKKFGCIDSDIDAAIRSFGFVPVSYDPMSRAMETLETFNDGRNTIYVRDVESAAERCRHADKVVVHTAGDFAL